MDLLQLFDSDSNFLKSMVVQKYGRTPNFSGRDYFYSCFQNPGENSDCEYANNQQYF